MAGARKVISDEITVDSFTGFPVRDYLAAADWYERLLGCPPAFFPNETEAVWELAEHRYLYIKVLPDYAGHAVSLFFLSDLDTFVSGAADRNVHAAECETLSNGVRKILYKDPDGNDVAFGGTPIP